MSVEDVSYLHAHSVQDSVLFFADSTNRDMTHYPSPAEYVVQFTEPIKLVVGVEIMDATIPCTMYAVDAFNDRLDLLLAPDPYPSSSPSSSGPTDTEVALLLAELGNVPAVVVVLEADGRADAVVLDASVAGAVTSGIVRSPVPTGFLVCVRTVFTDVALTLGPSTDGTGVSFVVTGVTFTVAAGEPLANAVSAGRLAISTVRYHALTSRYDVVAYDVINCDAAGVAACHGDQATATASGLLCRLRKYGVHINNGNYTAAELQTQLTLQLASDVLDDAGLPVNLSVLPSLLSQPIDVTSRFQLVGDTSRAFYVNARSSTAAQVLGFSTLATAADGGYRATPFGGDMQVFAAIPADAGVTPPGWRYSMRAPGIVNLLGPRYITLRCPEIEQYMYSGMTHGKHSTGIGIFKLPSAGEVSNLRFDFTSLVRKPFHPIGRLTRLTLRFERADGVLYDFKGANNTMLINVRYLAPFGTPMPGVRYRSVLNPDYDPDFMAWRLGPGAPADSAHDRDADDVAPTAATKQQMREMEAIISRQVLSEQQRYTY